MCQSSALSSQPIRNKKKRAHGSCASLGRWEPSDCKAGRRIVVLPLKLAVAHLTVVCHEYCNYPWRMGGHG